MRAVCFRLLFIFTEIPLNAYTSMKSRMEGWCLFADEEVEVHQVALQRHQQIMNGGWEVEGRPRI